MKVSKSSLFWGILLIGFGLFALMQTLGYEVPQQPIIWAYIFGGISLLSLIFYFVDGFRAWGWLFPAGIFGALSFMMVMVSNNVDNAAMVAPLFLGIGLPFVVAFFIDRANNWWALIPAGIMLFLGLLMLVVDTANDEWIGTWLLFTISLSFFVVYLTNRSTRTWALLVAYIMFVVSLAPAMSVVDGDLAAYFGSVLLFAIALPFFVVYFSSRDNWWAIIPAGVLTTVAVIATLGISGWIHDKESGGYSNAILMGGLAVTFAIVWLRHAKAWAKIVTIVLAALAVTSVLFAAYTEMLWPLAIIVVGAYLLYLGLRRKPVT
jgi:hypothetical protein